MKRIGLIISLALIMMLSATSLVFGADLKITSTSPKHDSTGAAVENMGVKVFFNQDVYSKDNEKANKKLIKLKDNKGKEVPARIIFTKEDKDVMLVLADTQANAKIKPETKYTMTIDEEFTAASGDTLGEGYSVSFTTQDPSSTVRTSMVLMVILSVGAVFFAVREGQNDDSKKKKRKWYQRKEEKNPYKLAKKKGKTVEEVIDTQDKRSEKQKQADERRKQKIKERGDKREAKRLEKEAKEMQKASQKNLKVSRPRPISEVGSTYLDKEAKLR